ncbi:MAG: NAD(P)/FAD-dependent oxidoreductase [Bryobacteraceae bacterium]
MIHTGQSYKQCPLEDSWDAIVIGSGMGGLTTAALLARHGGKRVLVLERHYTAGGFTHTFHRPGYEWDVGVHYIGEVLNPRSRVRAAFDHLTEGRLKWNAMTDIYDRIVIGERAYDFPTGTERFRARMKGYFPQEAAAIDRYISAVQSAAGASSLYFAEKAIPAPIARIAGPLMRSRFLRYSDQTTASVLATLTGSRELTGVLTGQWGDYGLPPGESSFAIHALIARHYFEGAAYPAGGASEIAAGMAPAIERAGGRIVVGADVARILTGANGEATGVRMADGREFRAKTVISDAGAMNTYARLFPREAIAGLGVLESLRAIPPSMSHICLYVGLEHDGAPSQFGESNLWIYREPDHDAALARFRENPEGPFPVLFISFPSAKDPTFAARYPGRATIEVVAPLPYRVFERWQDTRWKRRGPEYDALKQSLARRLHQELERYVPAVRGHIDCAELSTPLSTRHFANYPQGEIYGLSAVPARFRLRWAGARTPVRNLYLTGADAGSLGVTGALFGGVIAASLVLGRNLMSQLRPENPG